jgi:ankyrin repeat protein
MDMLKDIRSQLGQTVLNQALLEASTNDENEPLQLSIIELLIDQGADLLCEGAKQGKRIFRDVECRTPLIWAISEGQRDSTQMDIIKTLIKRGDNIERPDTATGATPLIWAVRYGNEEMISLLISLRCQIDRIDHKYGRTALHWAAYLGDYRAISQLLPSSTSPKGPTIEEKIQRTKFLEKWDSDGHTALMLAVQQLHEEAAEALIEKGADANCVSEKGYSLLVWTISQPNESYVPLTRLLVEKGADVNTTDKTGIPVLCIAAKKNYADIVKILLECPETDPWAVDSNSRTALDLSKRGGDIYLALREAMEEQQLQRRIRELE